MYFFSLYGPRINIEDDEITINEEDQILNLLRNLLPQGRNLIHRHTNTNTNTNNNTTTNTNNNTTTNTNNNTTTNTNNNISTRGLTLQEITNHTSLALYSTLNDTNNNNELCIICRSNFVDNDIIRKIGHCNHFFHSQCIDRWLHRNDTCPYCRQKIVITDNNNDRREFVDDGQTTGQTTEVSEVAITIQPLEASLEQHPSIDTVTQTTDEDSEENTTTITFPIIFRE